MELDVAQRHSAGIQRNDHVIQAADSALTLGHQPRDERAVTIPRNLQRNRAGLGLHRLGRAAVAGVGQQPARRVALLVPQMLGQFGGQSPLQRQFDQPRQYPALTGQRNLASIDLSQQGIHRARRPQRLGHLHRGVSINQPRAHVRICRHVLRSFPSWDLHRPSDTPSASRRPLIDLVPSRCWGPSVSPRLRACSSSLGSGPS